MTSAFWAILILSIAIVVGIIWRHRCIYIEELSGGNKMWRKIKCFFGYHAEDCVRAEVGGRNVQRCLYCDKIIHEYTVTPNGAKKPPIIRRKY